MSDYQIISDSSCDIPNEILEAYNIKTIPFYVSFDQEKYYKERVDISTEAFYSKLETEKIFPKTSLPSVQDYMNVFTHYIKEGKEILCLCLTDKFSGSYQSAINAKNIIDEEYEGAKITVVNSILATTAQGLLVIEAARMKKAGLTLEETTIKLEALKNTARIMFTVGTLEYLQKGGRIGKVSALAGTMLNLKPLIVLKEGELFPYGTIRGRKKSLKKIIDMTKEYFKEINEDYNDYNFALTTGNCFKEAVEVKTTLQEELNIKIDNPIFTIGVTIGTNTGPDPIGICFVKKYEKIK
ncbi:DegV family protein with EDD domain [Natranaerovirga hydrolytica]|uniref:DegV family protein with EDD domain n=1 Tax=Natranaerovirga hydrolytica TaxID=680378 RepID=A0A4R1N1E4_9FIRM|nr:DegV family protein [Natranaerovirga hydrolytica]TCK97814.1 DegV family protein with EDD domain [Natranaerovirga hydrolytica]